MKSLYLFFLFLTLSADILCCPYHDMLKRIARERQLLRERLRQHRSGLHKSQPPYSDESRSVGGLSSRRNHHINRQPETTRYTGYNSRRGYFVSGNLPPQRHVYIGSVDTVYRPENYVACPNSKYHVCPVGSVCVYEYGSYRCRSSLVPAGTCREGLRRVNISSTQFQCVDINECDDPQSNLCEQICRNTHGSFRCDCNPGFSPTTEGLCKDVDECSDGLRRCRYECVNTIGGYNCTCPSGYNKLDSECKDIDECSEEGICLEDEKCLNTFGGFECNIAPPCGPGYHRLNLTKAVVGSCVIDNYEAGISEPVSISYNKFALPSNYPAYRSVGRLQLNRKNGHLYSFRVIEGGEYFRVTRQPFTSYIRISTQQQLYGPKVYNLKILVSEFGTEASLATSRINSRIDLAFVVSAYDF